MPSDADLLEAWREGDRSAGERLLLRYQDKLFRFFDLRVSLDAEDLTQRTLLAVAERRDEIRSAESFRSFLFGAARHILLEHIRERSRNDRARDFSDVSGVDPGPSPSRVVAASEEQRLLLRVLQQLPLETQMLLELHYWEAMPTREIGDALGVPKSTVTTWLHRARLELREAIGTIGAREAARASLANDLERWATSLRELEARYPGDR